MWQQIVGTFVSIQLREQPFIKQCRVSGCFIQATQFVNEKLLERNPEEKGLFDVIILSNNSPESGMRIINSAKQHGKEIPPLI